MYEVETREQPEQLTAVMRGTVPRPELRSWLAAAYGIVATHLQRIGVPTAGTPFARYAVRDGSSLEVEAGLPVTEMIDRKDQVEPSRLPGGPVAATWHHGPFHPPEEMDPAYEAIEFWLARTGAEALGSAWEVHHSNPTQEPDADSWLTEVVQPISEP